MPAKKKPDTHNFLTRFPPKVWEQLEATASQAGIPANTMVVNYVSACLDAGMTMGVTNSNMSWSNVASYAPITGATFQARTEEV